MNFFFSNKDRKMRHYPPQGFLNNLRRNGWAIEVSAAGDSIIFTKGTERHERPLPEVEPVALNK